MLRCQPALGGLPKLLGLEGRPGPGALQEHPAASVEQLPGSEQVRALLDGLEVLVQRELELATRALEQAGLEGQAPQLVEHGFDGLEGLVHADPIDRGSGDQEQAGFLEGQQRGGDVEQHLVPVDELVDQQARATTAEDVVQQLEGQQPRVVRRRAHVADGDGGLAGRAVELCVAQTQLLGLVVARVDLGGAGIEPAELGLEGLQRRRGVHVPSQHDQGVGGRVAAVVPGLQLRLVEVLNVVHPSHHRVAVWVGLKHQGHQGLPLGAVVVVVDRVAALLGHDAPLLLQVLRGDGQGAHSIGLHVQHQIEGPGREGLHVGGLVLPGVAIGAAPRGLEQAVERAGRVVLRPVEHHVFEQMRDSCSADYLILTAAPVENLEGHHRHRMLLVQQHTQAVGELVMLDRQFHA